MMMEIEGKPLMVAIRCCTYNHEDYIRQCLDGFVMQKTNFRFVAIVHDDASTDKTAEIIREYAEKYPTIIEPIFEERNLYSSNKKHLAEIMNKACSKAKYFANCEGDDYWTDEFKLQKQFDYMESHPNCSLLHTAFKFYNQENHAFFDSLEDQKEYEKCKNNKLNVACEIFDFKYRVVTASSFLRTSVYVKIISDPDYYKYSFSLGDIQMWTMMLQYGEIGYLSDYTTIYRVHAGSACRPTDMKLGAKNSLSISEMQMHFLPKVRGAEYLRTKIINTFKKRLFKYRLFEPKYKSFIKCKECELSWYYEGILSNPITRIIVIFIWKLKRVVCRNSSTKISSMK